MNEKEALILGVMLGDGCLSVHKSRNGSIGYIIVVSGHIDDDREFLTEIVKPIFVDLFSKKVNINEQPNYGKIDLRIYSKDLLTFMNEKWSLPVGKSRSKEISYEFLNDQKLMKNIVSGFFATDGSLVITNNNGTMYPRIEFQNVSEKILKQIQDFLPTLGLEGGLYKMRRESKIVYRLQYNGRQNLLKFEKEIGFINPKHQLKFDEFKLEMLG
jgi:hypothetical protein